MEDKNNNDVQEYNLKEFAEVYYWLEILFKRQLGASALCLIASLMTVINSFFIMFLLLK